MTQEDKELLLQDLCARLPYGVKCYVPVENCTMELTGKRLNYFCFHKEEWCYDYSHELEIVIDPLNDINNNYIIKPYLRPLSSMTGEEKEELKEEHKKDERIYIEVFERITNGDEHARGTAILHFAADWCDKNHFDYKGLIERGLAIEVTAENNPYI